MEVRRTCSVQARTVCEVNVLQQAAFDSVLRENPHFARKMNELVVARQLDSSLARANVKGVDFQVSQSDLEKAVNVMERNMKEGLERRQMHNQSSSSLTATSHSSVSRKLKPNIRVSFDEAITKRKNHQIGYVDEESQIEIPARPSTAGPAPISDVIRDITRRSTRFADEDLINKIRDKAKRPLSGCFNTSITLDSFVDTCSDTEIDVSKKRADKYNKRRSTILNKPNRVTEDELEGHFKPGVLDIAKVRPVILNSQTEQQLQLEKERETLNSRISYQSKMMEQLLTKIDLLESRTNEALQKS